MTAATHFKKIKDPNFLGSWDLVTGADDKTGKAIYGTLKAIIKSVQQEEVIDIQKSKVKAAYKLVVTAHFTNTKPMILNTTNMKAIEKALGSPFIEFWQGKEIEIYVDAVKAFGDIHDALRIRPFAPPVLKVYTCTDCNRDDVAENMAIRTKKAFGVHLCSKCGVKRSEVAKQAEAEPATE